MRAVVARVRSASVTVVDESAPGGDVGEDVGEVVGEIGPGLLVLLGITHDDGPEQVAAMARKLHELRLLPGVDGGPERSCADTGAPLLVISQFTLYGDTRKGRRPSWTAAAPGAVAEPLVDAVVAALRDRGAPVETGRFGAAMRVASVNDGPFTVLLEV